MALTSTRQVLAWGFNAAGQLGDGTSTSSDQPVQIKLPNGGKATAVRSRPADHTLALARPT